MVLERNETNGSLEPALIAEPKNSPQLSLLHLTSSELMPENSVSTFEAVCNGVADGAYRLPVKALQQMTSSDQAEFKPLAGSALDAYKVGETVGSLVPFLGVAALTRGASNEIFGKSLAPGLLRNVLEQSAAGFVVGSVLTPTAGGTAENRYMQRLKQGGTFAATFAAMTAGASTLDRLMPAAGSSSGLLIGRRLGIAALSGAAGGIVNAELQTGFKASGSQLYASALGFASFSTIMEAGTIYAGNRFANQRWTSGGQSEARERSPSPESQFSASDVVSTGASAETAQPPPEPAEMAKPAQVSLASAELAKPAQAGLDSPELAKPEHGLPVWSAELAKQAQVQPDGRLEARWSNNSGNGTITRESDGFVRVVNQADKSSYLYDSAGKILHANNLDSRSFYYDENGELNRILSRDLGTIYRSRAYPDSYYLDLGKDAQGAPLIEFKWRGKADAGKDGSIIVSSIDGSKSTVYGADGSISSRLPSGRTELLAADYDMEKSVLDSAISRAYPEPARRLRMENLLTDFEKAASARELDRSQMAMFYNQLGRLIRGSGDSLLDSAQRRDLAEQVLGHAAFPTTVEQGYNSTCNVATIENRIYSRSPKDMAQLVADLAADGTYTTHSGKSVDLAHSLTGIKPDAEARESLRAQADGGAPVHLDGDRDWASQLSQLAMAKIKHLNTTYLIAGDTIVDPDRLVFSRDSHLLGLVPGEVEPVYDSAGKKLSGWNPSDKVFQKTSTGLKELDSSRLVFSKSQKLLGTVEPSAVQKLYDINRSEILARAPGTSYFDSSGKPVLYESLPGEITYDKLSPRPGLSPDTPSNEQERMTLLREGQRVPLKEMKDGKLGLVSSPKLGSFDYRDIANEVSGNEKSPFTIAREADSYDGFSTIGISSQGELERTMLEMQAERNLPAILTVHTGQLPWRSTQGSQGGWHVVNLQHYDPATKLAKISNQWGSKFNFMDKGISLQQLFESMAAPSS